MHIPLVYGGKGVGNFPFLIVRLRQKRGSEHSTFENEVGWRLVELGHFLQRSIIEKKREKEKVNTGREKRDARGKRYELRQIGAERKPVLIRFLLRRRFLLSGSLVCR